ncbi:MAG: DUF1634 domain-containing protein [Bacteroidetes bacterium]|nr:DUF1634 domain-containing protein [Bacteroidota bacterium]
MRLKKRIQDVDMQAFIGKMLRTGVTLSACVTVIGGLLYIFRHNDIVPDYRNFTKVGEQYISIVDILKGVSQFKARAIIQLGVLLLIATPIARVIFSVVAFLMEKDYLYTIITLVVLGIICYSIAGGVA